MSRRDVMAGATACAALGTMAGPAGAGPGPSNRPIMAKVTLSVNGESREIELDTRTSLLDAAREHLHLTGSKKASSP